MKKKALVDASSAILLYKAGVFGLLAEAYRLLVAQAVFDEICISGRPGADFFVQAEKQGALLLAQPYQAAENLSGSGDRRLGAGERQTFEIHARGMADFIILDDRRGALYCRSNRIPFVNALLCVRILNLNGYLSDPEFERVFNHVARIGYYSRWVIDFAADFSDLMLTRFHDCANEPASVPCPSINGRSR